MGVTYGITPIDTQTAEHFGLTNEVEVLLLSEQARFPTPAELRLILESFEGYTVEHHIYHTATSFLPESPRLLSSDNAHIYGYKYAGEDVPAPFYFRSGDEVLNVRILERLSQHCGPMLMQASWGGPHLVIKPGIDPAQMVEGYHAEVEAAKLGIELRALRSPDLPGIEDGATPNDPEYFSLRVQAFVAVTGRDVSPDAPAQEETFHFRICTPRWIADEIAQDGYVLGIHRIIVPRYDYEQVWQIIAGLCAHVRGPYFGWIADELGRFGERDWHPAPELALGPILPGRRGASS